MPSRAFGSRVPLEFDWFPEPAVVADGLLQGSIAVHDLAVPLRRSIPIVIENVKRTFTKEPDWPPWGEKGKQGPAHEYMETYTGTRMLRKSRTMYKHATSPTSFAVVGTNLEYLSGGMKDEIFHSSGYYPRNIYERPFIGLDTVGMQLVENEFIMWLTEIANLAAAGAPGGETFMIQGRPVFRPRSNLGTFLPGGFG